MRGRSPDWLPSIGPEDYSMQGLSIAEYDRRKEEVADGIIARLERHLPGLKAATLFREVRQTLSTGLIGGVMVSRLCTSSASKAAHDANLLGLCTFSAQARD